MKKMLLLVLGILIFSSMSLAQEELTHEEIVKDLSFWNKIKYNIVKRDSLLTAAGQERKCSEYPDIGPIIQNPGTRKTITCNNREALINAYTITTKWNFMGEWNSPITLGFSPKWAWECYYCKTIEGQCTSGETACYTQSSFKSCVNGFWSSPIKCDFNQICQNSRCQSFTCFEQWSCGSWGSCQNGIRRRTCTDAKSCGTTKAKPSTSERCEVVTNPPTNDPGGTENPPGTPGAGDPQLGNANIIASDITVEVQGREVVTNVFLENTGESMVDNMLLEIQLRPKGLSPLVFVGEPQVCDPLHPENVHRQFRLDKGEGNLIGIRTIAPKDGEYDVYGITVNKCWAVSPQGNVDYAPFGRGELLGTVNIDSKGRSTVTRTFGEGFGLSSIIDSLGSMIYLIFALLAVLLGLIIWKVIKDRK